MENMMPTRSNPDKINIRILAANLRLKKDLWNRLNKDVRKTLDDEMAMAMNTKNSRSSRFASILTVEIILRQNGVDI